MPTDALTAILQLLVTKFGTQIVAILAILGTCRILFKPTTDLILAIVSVTKTKKDDELVVNISANKFYKAFIWLVNYLLSIKLPK